MGTCLCPTYAPRCARKAMFPPDGGPRIGLARRWRELPRGGNLHPMMHRNLWAPWRMAYLNALEETDAADVPVAAPACFLCDAMDHRPPSEGAQLRLVLLSDDRGIILLNRFPYTSGHLLVAPRDHVGDLRDLTQRQRHDLMDLTTIAHRTVMDAFSPQGVNVGLNLGRAAGAGVPGHLHMHVLPRWDGDTNFMGTVGQVRVIPQSLEVSYEKLLQAIEVVNA